MSVNFKGAAAPSVAAVEKPKVLGESAAILAQIDKDKGKGVWMKGKDIPDVERIPTGLFEFDHATGGGFPRSRLSIVYGPESSGKTNICLCGVANAQKLPGGCNRVVWFDLEGTFDPKWAARFGVNVEDLIVVRPGYGEEAVDLFDALLRADDVAMVIVDSVAVVTSAKEADQTTEKADVGTASVLVKRMCNKMAIAFALEARRGHNPAVVFCNQTRFKIGVMFGDPETMPGGNTMKFLSSLTVRLYGKNKVEKAIHPDIPAFKDTTAVVKKAKVGVNRTNFTYDMALVEGNGLQVGESASWNAVLAHLKNTGDIAKGPKSGWLCLGEEFPTLAPIQDRYYNDKQYAMKLQAKVLESTKGQKFLIEADGAAKAGDKVYVAKGKPGQSEEGEYDGQ